MILDLIILAIILIFVIIGTARGAAKTLFNLIGLGLSVYLAAVLGPAAADWIYTVFFRGGIVSGLENAMGSVAQGASVTDALNALPDYVFSVLSPFGVTKESLTMQAATAAADSKAAAVNAVESVIKPALCAIISFFVIIILFILFIIIIKFIIRLVLKLFELPGLHFINRFFGLILGVFEGIIFAYLIVLLYGIISPLCADTSFVTPELIEQSIIFKSMYSFNIFNGIRNITDSLQALSVLG